MMARVSGPWAEGRRGRQALFPDLLESAQRGAGTITWVDDGTAACTPGAVGGTGAGQQAGKRGLMVEVLLLRPHPHRVLLSSRLESLEFWVQDFGFRV